MKSWSVGALPIVNRVLQRLKLEEFLRAGLPMEDRRVKVPTASVLLVLLRNLLLSREPLYGIGEWAARHAPDLLGLTTGLVVDRFPVWQPASQNAEGYRLLWYHSTRKAELDTLARSGQASNRCPCTRKGDPVVIRPRGG